MKRSLTYKIAFAFMALLVFSNSNAQKKDNSETTQRIDDYLELLKLGYTEIEIFQDLGNVNFLTENYEAASFWYEKLFKIAQVETIPDSYKERYDFALNRSTSNTKTTNDIDWEASIRQDYTIKKRSEAQAVALNMPGKTMNEDFSPAMSITKNGKVAFFSQAVQTKPECGIFSKKEIVHEIYRAENRNGEWKNFKKVAVCPKYYSAKHPTVSADGSRLFFASNMPGTYGKYDIYVSEIKADGSLGLAKNLGPKVNTKKNDLYPSLADGSLLFYASDGRKGYGGLDLFAVQVEKNSVSKSINLGSQINSAHDDFSLSLSPENGMGYVMSNRDSKNKVSQVAITYSRSGAGFLAEKDDNELMKVLNDKTETDYSSTVFDN
ncbi:TolB family protein [Croceitalea rosinachiae]|uniref:Cell envelope biogenesis protein OmpA n=1 Tax=Croceitalea rosinachiae TaxID=3075596 RepID=A0ABU3ACS3_9FLAO|nr:cell envelope biogenesis protein OmpA [Croceitalea sp. F388]MDT0607784.1 cell envelope biogenesis protein OmpA [Croceitalea sp. F388]